MFRTLKEEFGLGDLRCRGEPSLERWVELALLAYILVGLTRWGKQLRGERQSWGEVRKGWGWSLISISSEVRGWLATLWRLILGPAQAVRCHREGYKKPNYHNLPRHSLTSAAEP